VCSSDLMGFRRFHRYVANIGRWPAYGGGQLDRFYCIRKKTGAQKIVKEINQYQQKWLQHVQRMDTNRQPKQALRYRPKGRRNLGRQRKRWTDQIHLEG
jgi:hypothetical protein